MNYNPLISNGTKRLHELQTYVASKEFCTDSA